VTTADRSSRSTDEPSQSPDDPSQSPDDRTASDWCSLPRRLVWFLVVGLVPWTVTLYPGGSGFVFPWGLLSTEPALQFVSVTKYFFVYTRALTLPPHLLSWGVSTIVYAMAFASAAGATAIDREDRRVTAALLLIAAIAHLRFTLGTDHAGVTSLPVGPVALFALAWWFHSDDLSRLVGRE
jgi:uncharacterized protein (TIGR04206 family)